MESFERQRPVGTVYRAVVHAPNERGLAFWARQGFVMEGEVDTHAHFAHRGLDLEQPDEREPSLMLKRSVTAPIS